MQTVYHTINGQSIFNCGSLSCISRKIHTDLQKLRIGLYDFLKCTGTAGSDETMITHQMPFGKRKMQKGGTQLVPPLPREAGMPGKERAFPGSVRKKREAGVIRLPRKKMRQINRACVFLCAGSRRGSAGKGMIITGSGRTERGWHLKPPGS